MSTDQKDDPATSADERSKRAPPTIDLAASEVSEAPPAAASAEPPVAEEAKPAALASPPRENVLRAVLGGAVAAMLVLGAAWAAGLIGPQQAETSVAANVGELSTRLARVEASAARPAAPASDPALANRIDALEKAVAAARTEVAGLSKEVRTTAASLSEVKSMPRESAPVQDHLGPLQQRLSKLEDESRTLAAQLAKPPAVSKEEVDLRRLVVASMLESSVRRGEPFAPTLAVAKQVAANPSTLVPLEPFAAKGLPAEQLYLRDIVSVLQRMTEASAPARPAAVATQPAGVLDRLQSGMAKLVRIERDAGPAAKDPAAPAALAAEVRREDLATARQDVAKLPQAADPQIQAWIKSVDGREAALAAAQKFSAEALAAVGKSGQ